ncbi:hypothetical protein AWZ03_002146 [Drosophila navojoa]|uniref:Uncharacterized protein n=1 Tax=Drosophila navojoa TaxID=7232 RepID=A0A484BUB5_DRONA|nr:hypothetical protein AWZ03_002146 [Drosophila navojoa]
MRPLIFFALLASSFTSIKSLSDMLNCCQLLQEIKVILEKQDKELPLVWNNQANGDPEIQALYESIGNLQGRLCQEITDYDQCDIQWMLQRELSDLQARVENLQSLVSNGLQEKYHQQCLICSQY